MEKPLQVTGLISQAFDQSEVPRIYFNQFAIALGISDVVLVVQNGPDYCGILNMSYTTAKTLYKKLELVINELEQKTGRDILTTDETRQYLKDQEQDEEQSDEKKDI